MKTVAHDILYRILVLRFMDQRDFELECFLFNCQSICCFACVNVLINFQSINLVFETRMPRKLTIFSLLRRKRLLIVIFTSTKVIVRLG